MMQRYYFFSDFQQECEGVRRFFYLHQQGRLAFSRASRGHRAFYARPDKRGSGLLALLVFLGVLAFLELLVFLEVLAFLALLDKLERLDML